MKKFDFGQTITILANIGVIAGIAFLAVEIQQNNRLLSTQASYVMLQNRVAGRVDVLNDSELASLMFKLDRGEPLSPVEEFRIRNGYEANIIGMEWEYQQYLAGGIERLPIDVWKDVFADPEFMSLGWEPSRGLLTAEFIAFIEANVIGP